MTPEPTPDGSIHDPPVRVYLSPTDRHPDVRDRPVVLVVGSNGSTPAKRRLSLALARRLGHALLAAVAQAGESDGDPDATPLEADLSRVEVLELEDVPGALVPAGGD